MKEIFGELNIANKNDDDVLKLKIKSIRTVIFKSPLQSFKIIKNGTGPTNKCIKMCVITSPITPNIHIDNFTGLHFDLNGLI